MTRSITSGEHTITFSVVRARRKTFEISITPAREIRLKAPLSARETDIDAIMTRRIPWILKKLAWLDANPRGTGAPEYRQGAVHYYLGRAFTLRLEPARRTRVTVSRDNIIIAAPHMDDPERIRAALDAWYRKRAAALIPLLLDQELHAARGLGLPRPELRIRTMRRRWGSCTRAKVITISSNLMKHSLDCLRYVIRHELAHLKHMNHGRDYYRLLERLDPRWRENRRLLNENAGR